jgi:hypothetical protein
MKTHHLFVLLFTIQCSVLATSCSSEKEKKPIVDSPIYTLIFMDKTRSVDINEAFVSQKYQQILSDLIAQNVRQKGDKVEVYFIHENTSKAKALSLTCRTETEDVSAMNATDREGSQTTFGLMLEREKMIFTRQITSKLAIQNLSASRQNTDIWGSLPVIAKAAEKGMEVKVYYLSDMIESMNGTGRRDFHHNAPSSNQEAETWAKADAKTLKNYALGAADIKIALPFEPTSSTRENNPTITVYWNILLQELGAMSVEEI